MGSTRVVLGRGTLGKPSTRALGPPIQPIARDGLDPSAALEPTAGAVVFPEAQVW